MDINFVKQFKHFWKVMLVLLIILNLVFLCALAISNIFSIPMEYLLEDPASLYKYSQFVGFSTSIGLLVLASNFGVIILLVSLNRKLSFEKRKLASIVLLGLMSIFLFMDDAFLLHERVFTGLLHVGERYIFLIYFMFLFVFLFYYRNELLSEGTSFLVITFLMFGLSIAMDTLTDKNVLKDSLADGAKILEEYFKLGGYLFWTALVILKARAMILLRLDRDGSKP